MYIQHTKTNKNKTFYTFLTTIMFYKKKRQKERKKNIRVREIMKGRKEERKKELKKQIKKKQRNKLLQLNGLFS